MLPKTALNWKAGGGTVEEIRGAFYLAQPDDAGHYYRGPAGDMFYLWKQGMARSITAKSRSNAYMIDDFDVSGETPSSIAPSGLPETLKERTAELLKPGSGCMGANPVSAATAILMSLITEFAHNEAEILLITDTILARRLGWKHPLPLFRASLTRNDLRCLLVEGDRKAFETRCHYAIAKSAKKLTRLAQTLGRRANDLRAISPKLRAKGSDKAVELFLTEDAILPATTLSPKIKGTNIPMTSRSARRLCDRLVELGVVKELTGRATFRMYGIAS